MSKRFDLQGTTPVFKTHPFFLDQTREGRRNWEIRLHDMADDRIYQLSWLSRQVAPPEKAIDGPLIEGPIPGTFIQRIAVGNRPEPEFKPDVDALILVNAEDETDKLMMQYLGMEFVQQMPGWCVLVLGDRLCLECRHTYHPLVDCAHEPIVEGLPDPCLCKGGA